MAHFVRKPLKGLSSSVLEVVSRLTVRFQLILVGIVIAANALMMTVLGILLNQGALM